ncbi:MAG: right-handed parallel beta-helix repeat-containing protein [Thermoanaerobaculia bacterium]
MKNKAAVVVLVLLAILVFAGAPAYAQATRTWVSGVGDDANPCSRTAPCKTFAGAISKTAPNGEINVLDPGGFGAVTITKPITISSWGFEAGVLVSGTNGIIINVPNAGDVVILRGLDIEGLTTGLSGITVLTGGNVFVENCTINHFTVSGINFVTTVAGSQLHVVDSIIRNNGAAATGQGVLVQPSAAATANLNNVRLTSNTLGVNVKANANVSVANSVVTNTPFAGLVTASGATLTVENSVVTHNAVGFNCVAGSTIRIGNNSITDNATTFSTGGSCLTFKNNDVDVAITVTPVNPQ